MSDLIIGKCMNLIKQKKPELKETELQIIQYGIHGLYLTLTKAIVLLLISYLLNQLLECLFLLLIFGLIRSNSYGLHTPKSWMCWVTTIPIFILLPWIAINAVIPSYIKYFVGLLLIIYIFKHTPADTPKRPIINQKRRQRHNLLATLTATIYIMISLYCKNIFIGNVFFLSLLLMCILISPTTYKIFNLKYNNYLDYLQ